MYLWMILNSKGGQSTNEAILSLSTVRTGPVIFHDGESAQLCRSRKPQIFPKKAKVRQLSKNAYVHSMV